LGKNRKEIKDQMMANDVNIKLIDVPEGWSTEAADFINKVKFNLITNKLKKVIKKKE